MIFGGRKNEKGEVVDSGGSLSFDKYGAGQIVQLAGLNDKDGGFVGLIVNDGGQRVWIGRRQPGVASLSLTDSKGKDRIAMHVAQDGTPSLAFLDAEGRVIQQIAPVK